MAKKGRPRKSGDRHRCGKLKPQTVAPNERVYQERKAMLGDTGLDIATASDPLDFALARGFLSMGRYRAAMSFAKAYAQAQLGAPGLDSGGPQETATTVDTLVEVYHPKPRNGWDVLDTADIVRVFDAVFNVTGTKTADEIGAEALARWKAIMAPLNVEQQTELMATCVRRSWPQWIIQKAAGKDVADHWDRKRVLLETGLDTVSDVLRAIAAAQKRATSAGDQAETAAPDYEPAPPAPRGQKVTERLVFVDEDGEPVQPVSERGVPFEVERRVRRA